VSVDAGFGLMERRSKVAEPGFPRPPGSVSATFGLAAIASTAAVAVISFTPVDPPGWTRVSTFWLMLLAIPPVSILTGVVARPGYGRVAGLGLGAVALTTLIVMFSIAE
jgi:hypothetical protein